MEVVGLDERWAERPWCWAAPGEDGWELDLPGDAALELARAAAVAPGWADGLAITVVTDEGDPESFTGAALTELVSDRIAPLTHATSGPESTAAVLDDDQVAELADAAAVLAVVLTRWLDHAGPAHPDAARASNWAESAARAAQELHEPLRRRIRPRRDGTFRVRLVPAERELIDQALGELSDALGLDDPNLHRLFPTAYPDDDERQAGWAALVHGELIESRRATIDTVRAALDRTSMDEGELHAFMRAINDLRLVLGTRRDVGEDGRPSGPLDDDAARQLLVHEHLGLLLYDTVAALRSTL